MNYSFGTFHFDGGSLELTREGRRVHLEPQPARALARLLAAAGALVTRDEMRDAIWGGHTHVDYDRGLAYCIGQVRTALGDSGDNPRFVQTLPKRGFRFVAPVATAIPDTEVTASDKDAPSIVAVPRRPGVPRWVVTLALLGLVAVVGWWRLTPGAAVAPTVAVSIFDNETGDADYDRFVHGLSDVVVTRLTALAPGRVGVIGNAAPLRQPRNLRNLTALASSLNAGYIVLGQLQRQDDRLRFIVHFIRLRDQVHLSAQRFIRPADEVSQFEADVATEAERLVRVHLLTVSGS